MPTKSLKLSRVPLGKLTPDPENVREHSDENLAAIESSLRQFGQQRPIVVDRNGKILAGNGTFIAAKRLGLKSLHAIETDLEGEAARAFAIADNRTGELSVWDYHALALSVKDLPADMIAAIGFSPDQLASLEAIGRKLEEERISGAGSPKPVTCPKCGAVQ